MFSLIRPRRAAGLVAALCGCFVLIASARAAEPAASLKLVPADAAFYDAMLHNKEQVDIVANSQAWAKLKSLPAVQDYWKKYQDVFNSGWQQFTSDPDNKDLVDMLADAGSDEVFCYGDNSWVGFLQLMQEINAANQFAQFKGAAGDKPGQDQARAILESLSKHADEIQVPSFVLGFKVSDAQRAEKQIKRLEGAAKALAAQAGPTLNDPDFKDRIKRTKIGDASFLTFTLDGSEIPWDNIPWKDVQEKPGEFKALQQKLKDLKLTISLGVSHGFLLLGVGPSTDQLAQLGGTGPRLDSEPAFKPLTKYADRKLTSIGYASRKFLQAAASGGADQMRSMFAGAKAGLAKADLTDDERKALEKLLDDLGRNAKTEPAELGPVMSFEFLTDRGYEGYSYSYGKHPGIDGSKPLTLLEHVGGSPVLAAVSRSKPPSVADYEKGVKQIQEIYEQLDKILADKLKGDDKKNYEKAKEDFLPLVKRLDETTDKLLIPALQDGQIGFVLDAQWKSKQWFKAMPAMETAMPGPEIAVILGVSNADSLLKAMSQYREIINEGLAKLKTYPNGDKMPDIQIPEPKKTEGKAGTLYSWAPPPEWGLDSQIVLTAGLSKSVAVLTFSHECAQRLLASKALKVEGGPLANKDQPMAEAFVLSWPGFVDANRPWVEDIAVKMLELEALGTTVEDSKVDPKTRAAVLDQIHTVLDVLKCWRGETSATTVEDGVLVTHHESVFRDLK